MNRIVVASLADAQRFHPRAGERYAVLSFVDVGAEPPRLLQHKGFVDRLIIHADDCTPHDRLSAAARPTPCPLSEKQAVQIARFVRANSRADVLMVHCHIGASRSPAAALAIAEAFAITQVEMVTGPGVVPNPHVRELVRAALRRS